MPTFFRPRPADEIPVDPHAAHVRLQWAVLAVYLALFILSLPIPLLHEYRLNAMIERLRPGGGLLPIHLLLLRHMGDLSQIGPVIIIGCMATSFWRPVLRRFEFLCFLALAQGATTIGYGLYTYLILVEIPAFYPDFF